MSFKAYVSTVRAFGYGIVIGAAICLVATLAGCNTIAGFADDVKAISKGTQEWLVKQQEK